MIFARIPPLGLTALPPLFLVSALALSASSAIAQSTPPEATPVLAPTMESTPEAPATGVVPAPATPGPEKAAHPEALPSPQDQRTPLAPPSETEDLAPKTAPYSVVEHVLQAILVERDLEAARAKLVNVLPAALASFDNPAWTGRVYALLASVEALEGDEVNANRLFLRAITLSPTVMVEPQLGDVPRLALEEARRQYLARPEDATLSFEPPPAGTQILVDGVPIVPGNFQIRAGDHLIQVVAEVGVVGRQWITLEPLSTTHEPPPLPEIRMALAPLTAPPPLTEEAQEQLLEKAYLESQAVTEARQSLEQNVRLAADRNDLVLAACLIDHQREAKRISEEVRAFQERLESALERQDAAEADHLVSMLSLAKEVASQNVALSTECYAMAAATPESTVVVLQEPSSLPQVGAGVLGAPSLEHPPLNGRYEASPRHTSLSAPPALVWQALEASSGSRSGSADTSPSFDVFTDLTLAMVADSNPSRAAQGVVASPPLLGLRVTPRAGLRLGPVTLVGRYPLLLEAEEVWSTHYDVALTLTHPSDLSHLAGSANVTTRSEAVRIDALGAAASPFQRRESTASAALRLPTPSALRTVVSLEATTETFTHPFLLGVKRQGGMAGLWVAFFPFPLTELEARASLLSSLRSPVPVDQEPPLPQEEQTTDLVATLGTESWMSSALRLGVRLGANVPLASSVSRLGPTVVGEARLFAGRGARLATLTLGREVFHPFYTTEGIRNELRLSASTGTLGWLQLEATGRVGSEVLHSASDANPSWVSYGLWPLNTYAGLEASVRITLRSQKREARLELVYMPTYHTAVPLDLEGESDSASAPMKVHEAMLELSLRPLVTRRPKTPPPITREPVVLPPMEGPLEDPERLPPSPEAP